MKTLCFLLFALLLNFIRGYPAQADMTAQQLTIWQQEQQDLLKSKFKAWTAGITQQLLEQISNFEHDATNSDCSESTLGLETLLDKLKKDFDQLHGNQHLNLDSQFSIFQRLKSRFEFLKSESGSEGASRCLDRFKFYHNQFTSRIVTKDQDFASRFRDRVVDSLIRNMKARNLAEVAATLRQRTYENTVLLEQVADKLLRTESYYMQGNFEHIRYTVWNLAKQSPEHAVLLTNAVLNKLKELNYLESTYTLKLAHTVHHTSNRLRKFPIQIQNLFSKDVLCIKNFGSSAFIHESEPLIKPEFVEDTSTSAVDVFPTTTFAPSYRSLSTSQGYIYTSSYENRSTPSQDFTHTFQSPKTSSQNFTPSYDNRSTQSQDSYGSTPARSFIESSRNTQPHQNPSSTTQGITPSNRYTSTTARTTTQWHQNPNAMLPNYPTSLKYAGTPRYQRSAIRTVAIEIKMKRNQKYTDGLNVTEEECGWVTQSMRGDNYNDPVVFRFHRTVNDPERNWTLASQGDRVMLTSDGAYNINLDWEVSVVKTYSHQNSRYGLGFKFRPSPASNTFSKFICHGRQHSSRYSYEAPLLLSREYASSENANSCTWTLTPCKDVSP